MLVSIFVFLKMLSLILFFRNFISVLLILELILMKIFLVLKIFSMVKFFILFMFLVISACGSVMGLSILVKISRKSNNKNFLKNFY